MITSEGDKKMTKEQLIALGLAEDQAEKVANESKKELEAYIPKSRFDEVNTAKKEAEKQVKERDVQLEDAKKNAGDNETLRQQLQKVQDENKANMEKAQADLKDMQLSSAIKLAIAGKAQDEDIVTKQFDKSKLILGEDGKITGLDEQLKALQESKSFLFKQEEKPNNGFTPITIGGTGGQGGAPSTDAALAAAFGIPTK